MSFFFNDTATTEIYTLSLHDALPISMRLGVDPRKADQMVRGTVNLPHGTGKTARVIVFATGDKAAEAEAAGADVVGSDDLIERIQGGFLDFDAAIATPDQMAKVGRIARSLGPRGLMPNPKTGTVTPDVAKAVNDIKGGKINFRVDKQARSEEHTSELQSRQYLVCRLLLEKKKTPLYTTHPDHHATHARPSPQTNDFYPVN